MNRFYPQLCRWLFTVLVAWPASSSLAAPSQTGAAPAAPADPTELTQTQLESLLNGQSPVSALRIEWAGAVLFGRGVVILGIQHAQVSFAPEKLRPVLQQLVAMKFAALPPTLGGDEAIRPRGRAPIRIASQIKVTLGTASKTVTQLGGPPAPELEKLGDLLDDLVSGAAATRITAANLPEALQKVAAGDLAPEALRLSFNVYPRTERPNPRVWYALIADGVVTHGAGPVHPQHQVLDSAKYAELVRALAQTLQQQKADELPVNVRFTDQGSVVDFRLEVLGFDHNVSTAEATRISTPEAETRFGQIYKAVGTAVGKLP